MLTYHLPPYAVSVHDMDGSDDDSDEEDEEKEEEEREPMFTVSRDSRCPVVNKLCSQTPSHGMEDV